VVCCAVVECAVVMCPVVSWPVVCCAVVTCVCPVVATGGGNSLYEIDHPSPPRLKDGVSVELANNEPVIQGDEGNDHE
jgi:hypothetical protein